MSSAYSAQIWAVRGSQTSALMNQILQSENCLAGRVMKKVCHSEGATNGYTPTLAAPLKSSLSILDGENLQPGTVQKSILSRALHLHE